jgi:hypothetical protein
MGHEQAQKCGAVAYLLHDGGRVKEGEGRNDWKPWRRQQAV